MRYMLVQISNVILGGSFRHKLLIDRLVDRHTNQETTRLILFIYLRTHVATGRHGGMKQST